VQHHEEEDTDNVEDQSRPDEGCGVKGRAPAKMQSELPEILTAKSGRKWRTKADPERLRKRQFS
jgi:hypothetical protein